MTETSPKIASLHRPAPDAPYQRVFIRDLRLEAELGVHAHEKTGTQPIVVNIELEVSENASGATDALGDALDYEAVADDAKRIVSDGRVQLVETLVEKIAAACLARPLVERVRVRIDKPNALPDAAAAGVEIERSMTRR